MWVPRADVLVALVAADPDARLRVLLDHRDEVLDDCAAALADVVDGGYAEQAVLMRQAVDVLRDGMFGPAQAMAGCVLDTVLRDAAAPSDAPYREWRQVAEEDFPMGEFRFYTTIAPLAPALARFKKHNGDPVPPVFNRHAVAHAAGAVQFTGANAVIGVMLAVSVIREFHERATSADTGHDAA